MAVSTTLLALAAVAAMQPGPSALMGRWGGEHVILIVDAKGARLSLDCGAGHFTLPDQIDRNGDFDSQGSLELYASGPTQTTKPVPIASATYKGHLENDRLTLEVISASPLMRRHYVLVRNQRTKLVRCL